MLRINSQNIPKSSNQTIKIMQVTFIDSANGFSELPTKEDSSQTGGSKSSVLFTDEDGETWRVKDGVLHRVVTESIALNIANPLGIKSPETIVCIRSPIRRHHDKSDNKGLKKAIGSSCIFVKYFLEQPSNQHKNQPQSTIHNPQSTIDFKEGKHFLDNNDRYTLNNIKKSFKKEEFSPLLIEQFTKLLLYDALIGNTDRNNTNWGIIKYDKKESYELAPNYDPASSLGAELNIKRIKELIQEPFQFESYIKTGLSRFYSNNSQSETRITHKRVIQTIKKWPAFKKNAKKWCNDIEKILPEIKKFLDTIPKIHLKSDRKTFINLVLEARLKLLKETLGLGYKPEYYSSDQENINPVKSETDNYLEKQMDQKVFGSYYSFIQYTGPI